MEKTNRKKLTKKQANQSRRMAAIIANAEKKLKQSEEESARILATLKENQRQLANLRQKKYRMERKKNNTENIYIHCLYEFHVIVYKGGVIDSEYDSEISFYHRTRKSDGFDVSQFYDGDKANAKAMIEVSNQRVKRFKLKEYHIIGQSSYYSHYKDIRKRDLRAAKPYNYKFTMANDLNIPENDGECIANALYSMYKSYIPTLTLENIDQILTEGCKLMCTGECKGHNFEHVKYFLCLYKISDYMLDIKNKVQDKVVFDKSQTNYPAFICYIIDNHLYLVTDKKARDHIVKVNANKTQGMHVDTPKEEVKINDEYILYDNQELDELQNITVYYEKDNLKDVLLRLFKEKLSAYKNSFYDGKVTSITYDNNVVLKCNPNICHSVNQVDIMKVCNIFGLQFTNQSLSALSWEIFNQFNEKRPKTKRINIAKSLVQEVLKKQAHTCKRCEVVFGKFEIDHITPLSDGGDNSIENLQALCPKCHEEKTNVENIDRYFNLDVMKSSYNSITKPIFTKAKNAFICGGETEEFDSELLLGLDSNKERRNNVRYSTYNYCVFTSLDEPTEFNGKIEDGFYYVVTQNYLPFKGNDWYSRPVIEYALEKKIIQSKDIKYQIIPSYTIQYDHFNKFIDFVIGRLPLEDEKMAKISKRFFNCFVGCFGGKTTKNGTVTFTNNLEEASYCSIKYQDMVYQVEKDIYEIKSYQKVIKDDNYVPIFNQILDLEAIELHKQKELAETHQGKVVYLNTDQVVALFPDKEAINAIQKDIEGIYWDEEKTVPKYKLDSHIKHKNKFQDRISTDLFQLEKKEWSKVKDPCHNDFEEYARALLDQYRSFNLDGRAGTGKSTLLKAIMKELENRGLKYQATAPTNKACNILKGLTLHKFFSLLTKSNQKAKVLGSLNYIIVDEISMVKEVFYRFFYHIKTNYPHIKWIIAGDFKQLPPVCDFRKYEYEGSAILKEVCDSTRVMLTECRRADKKFFDECMNPSTVDISSYGKKVAWKHLCYHNSKRKKLNEDCMNLWIKRFPVKNVVTVPKFEKDKQSQDILVYRNLPLIGAVTNSSLGVVNCEDYVVKAYDSETTVVKELHGELEINMKTQELIKYFYPAYAVTCYRAQGATYDFPYCIHEWEVMDDTMKYVCFSRATDRENVNIFE